MPGKAESEGKTRTESDSMGAIEVPAGRYWGAQTQRSLENFRIGQERTPKPVIRALGLVKKAAAIVNASNGDLDSEIAGAIVKASEEVIDGELSDHFPLVVWQTGSGTQSNMNANEVIANRAVELLGGELGAKTPVHPNDHVNLGQSSNDTFPTAMHIAAAQEIHHRLLPALHHLHIALAANAEGFNDIVKIGRTHLQDATPLTLGQEFSGYAKQVDNGIARIGAALPRFYALAQGGTAVGTGLNTKAGFDKAFATEMARLTGLPFRNWAEHKGWIRQGVRDRNGSPHGPAVPHRGKQVRGARRTRHHHRDVRRSQRARSKPNEDSERPPLARIGPAFRFRRVDVTRQRARLVDHARQGQSDAGGSAHHGLRTSNGQPRHDHHGRRQRHLKLNVFKPVMIYDLLQSIRLLGDSIRSFTDNLVVGIEPNRDRIAALVADSLMLVAALNPHIGYDNAAKVAKKAFSDGITLREAVLTLGLVTAEQYDDWVQPEQMVRPSS